MITTVTLNPAVDMVYILEELKVNGLARAGRVLKSAAGKGINVSRILSALGEDTCALSPLGGDTGQYIIKELERHGIAQKSIGIEGETRTNIKIICTKDGSVTEVQGTPPILTNLEVEDLARAVDEAAGSSDIVVLSGSIPGGVPCDIYGRLIGISRKSNVKIVLDTAGESMISAVSQGPYLIKPNILEAEHILGRDLKSQEDILEGCREFCKMGASNVIISMGKDGSYACIHGQYYRVVTPKVQSVNTVGCGDSFVAGMCAGIARNYDPDAILRLAAAVATAKAMEDNVSSINKENIENLKNEIIVYKL